MTQDAAGKRRVKGAPCTESDLIPHLLFSQKQNSGKGAHTEHILGSTGDRACLIQVL